MKIKIQKTGNAVTFRKVTGIKRNLEVRKDIYETAELFFETFPQFKQVIISDSYE